MASTIKVDPDQVRLVREALFARIREDDYDEKDIERYKTQDDQVARHVKPNSKKQGKDLVDETVDAMIRMLEWRAEYDVPNSSEFEFDQRTVKAWSSFVFVGGKDKKGAKIIWTQVHNWTDDLYDKVPDGKRYGASLMERWDVDTWNDRGYTYWANQSKAGPSNVSIESTKYFCSVMPFFRGGLQYLGLYEMPMVARSIWPIVVSLLPDINDQTVMASKADIEQYLDLSELPSGAL